MLGSPANLDIAAMRNLLSGPGVDSRQWISYGLVCTDTDASPIEFDEDDYYQPLVEVTLQPSAVGVRCRVGMDVSGAGEGEYYPLVKGDEVLVAIPEGDEKAGCVIIARLANKLDKFPKMVAGSPTNKNNFGFRRMMAPYTIETAGGYTIRHATTGAFIAITKEGNLVLSDGNGGLLRVGADAHGFQSADGKSLMLLDEASGDIVIQAGELAGASMLRMYKKDGLVAIAGAKNLYLTAGGSPPVQHNVSLEQVIALIVNVCGLMPVPAPLTPAAIEALVAIALPLAAIYPLTASLAALPAALAIPQTPATNVFGVGSARVLVG